MVSERAERFIIAKSYELRRNGTVTLDSHDDGTMIDQRAEAIEYRSEQEKYMNDKVRIVSKGTFTINYFYIVRNNIVLKDSFVSEEKAQDYIDFEGLLDVTIKKRSKRAFTAREYAEYLGDVRGINPSDIEQEVIDWLKSENVTVKGERLALVVPEFSGRYFANSCELIDETERQLRAEKKTLSIFPAQTKAAYVCKSKGLKEMVMDIFKNPRKKYSDAVKFVMSQGKLNRRLAKIIISEMRDGIFDSIERSKWDDKERKNKKSK